MSRPLDVRTAWPAAAVALAAALPLLPGLTASQWLSHPAGTDSLWGFAGGFFMPLTWLSRKAAGEWIINVLLHGAASVLVFVTALELGRRVLQRRAAAELPCALMAGLLFAMNPMRISLALSDAGRPALLSALLLLASFHAYLRYRDAEDGRPWLWAALISYALACLAWTGALAWPLILAVLDDWRPGRAGRARWPNLLAAPTWAAISFALLAYVALVYAMNGHYLAAPPRLPHWSAGFELRRLFAGLTQAAGQLVWPRPESLLVPFVSGGGFSIATGAAATALLLLAAWRLRGAAAWPAACLALYVSSFFAAWDPSIIVAQTDAARAAYLPTAFLLVAAAPLASSWLEDAELPIKRAALAGVALLVALAARASLSASFALRRDGPQLAQAHRALTQQAVDELAQGGGFDAEDAPALSAVAGDADLDEAVKLLKTVPDMGADIPAARINLALRLNSAGRVDEAMEQLQQAVRVNPSLAVARNDLGFFLLQRGRVQEAIEQLKEAVRLDPNMALAQNNLAAAQAALTGGLPPAERARRSQALFNAGVAAISRGKPAEGVEKLSQAGLLDPGNAAIPFDIGVAYVQLGRFDQGEAAFRRSVSINPSSPQAHFNLGFCMHQQGRLDEAVGEYREAIRYDPNAANAYLNAGVALTAQNRLAEADQFCSQAARLDPGAASNPHCYRKR